MSLFPLDPKVVAERSQLIDQAVDRLMAYAKDAKLIRHHDRFAARLVVRKMPNGRRATGGSAKINIGLKGREFSWRHHLRDTPNLREPVRSRTWERTRQAALQGEWMFVEYARHMNDPEIGNIVLNDAQEQVTCVVAHELAHAIQQWNGDPGWQIGHGKVWQKIYRAFRRHLGFTQDGRKDIPVKRHPLPDYAKSLPGAWQEPEPEPTPAEPVAEAQFGEQLKLAI